MTLLKFIFLTLGLLVLPGCAFIHSFDENLPQQIEYWIKHEQYGQALDTLDYIDKQHKDYHVLMQLRKTIQKRIPELERQTIQQGKKLLGQEKWHEAIKVYEYALARIPNNRAVQKAYDAFINKRAAHLKQLKLKLLQNKTNWLLDDKKIREEMAAVIPRNHQARWILQDHNADIDNTTRTLLECVDDSIEVAELDVARQCLRIARQLKPSQSLVDKLTLAEKQLGIEVNARSRHLTERGNTSLSQAKQALAQGNYTKVKNLLDSLPIQDKKNEQVLAFRKQSDLQLADYIDNRIREGRRLYSRGEIQQAYLMWKSLQALAPNNKQLAQLVKRSVQILNKLRQIENNPDQVVTPPNRNNQ